MILVASIVCPFVFEVLRGRYASVRPARASFVVRTIARFRLHTAALQALADAAVLEVAAFRGALRGLVPDLQPVAVRRPEPGGLRAQLRQSELFPEFSRAIHVLALRQ